MFGSYLDTTQFSGGTEGGPAGGHGLPPTKKKFYHPCQLSAHGPYQHSAGQRPQGPAQLAFWQLFCSAQQRTYAHKWLGDYSMSNQFTRCCIPISRRCPPPAVCRNLALPLHHRRGHAGSCGSVAIMESNITGDPPASNPPPIQTNVSKALIS